MTSLVKIENNEPLASTLTIAKGFEVSHKAVLQLVKKYGDRIKKHSTSPFKMRLLKNKKGRDTEYFLLNEAQTMFLVSLMRNTDIVVDFKDRLISEFVKQKAIIANISANLQNQEWQQLRSTGKITRRIGTDTIKKFVEYATKQGSRNAKMYYANLTTMENKALFFLEMKFKNLRDVLDGQQLGVISTADQIIEKALTRGMDESLSYKEIYIIAKENILAFSAIIGRSQISAMNQIGGLK